ncbi:hypothetical protein BpHYR1_043107 [Brachionus plicatilis]|uniref:Uncharacterized protein n=1 Tax=Brachionus plicatilis TaxID=10195 RepID=A0A3M7T1W3_BRAPC|nr:hypothetical protein BpHYR1_043107 [Brachionus plicatilis]
MLQSILNFLIQREERSQNVRNHSFFIDDDLVPGFLEKKLLSELEKTELTKRLFFNEFFAISNALHKVIPIVIQKN